MEKTSTVLKVMLLLSFFKYVPLIMDVKMICINIYSNEYTFIIIIAERAWESGEGSSKLAALLFGLCPLIVFLPFLSVFIVLLGGITTLHNL